MAKIKAKHAGTCADCSKAFAAGTPIRWFRSTGALCATPCTTRPAPVKACAKCAGPTELGTVMCAPCHAELVATFAPADNVRALLAIGVSPSLLAHDDDGRIVRPDLLPPPDPTFAATLARRAVPCDPFAEGIAAARSMLATVLA